MVFNILWQVSSSFYEKILSVVFSCFLNSSTVSNPAMLTWLGMKLLHLVEISKLWLFEQIKIKPTFMLEITCNDVVLNKMCLCMSPCFVVGKTEV